MRDLAVGGEMLRGLSMTTGTFVIIVALLTASASILKQWELIWNDYKSIAQVIEEKNLHLHEGVKQTTEGAQKHANNVTEIAMSMQSQDITRQRLEKGIGVIAQLQVEVTENTRNSQVAQRSEETPPSVGSPALTGTDSLSIMASR